MVPVAALDFGGVCQQQRVQQIGGAAAVFDIGVFILLYGGMLAALVVYAFGWQQVIKHLPLTTAYADEAITVVWGILLGFLLFGESITPAPGHRRGRLLSAGIVLFVRADNEGEGGQ